MGEAEGGKRVAPVRSPEAELLRAHLTTSIRQFAEPPWDLFNSWDRSQQARYMAARDRDSARLEADPWLKEFYLSRAQAYEEDVA
jgi:hypothetical protein